MHIKQTNKLSSIKIGVSRCLLGDKVRYDGATKYSSLCSSNLASEFELVSVCPEVEAGGSVPRPPIELIRFEHEVKAVGRDDSSIDMTVAIKSFTQQKLPALRGIAGFVVATRSPSCGFNSVPLKNLSGHVIKHDSSGLFTHALEERFPGIPIIEEINLGCRHAFLSYQIRVISYHQLINDSYESRSQVYQLLQISDYHLIAESVVSCMALLHNRLKQLDLAQLSSLLNTLRD